MAQKGWGLVKNVPVEAMHLSSIVSVSGGDDTTFNVRAINNHAFFLECRFYCAQILNNMYTIITVPPVCQVSLPALYQGRLRLKVTKTLADTDQCQMHKNSGGIDIVDLSRPAQEYILEAMIFLKQMDVIN